jgi:hypothetical protein
MSASEWQASKNGEAMTEERRPIPGTSELVLALKTIVERRFVSGSPSENDLTKASPLLTLERFGGPATPAPEELATRLAEIRGLLGDVAPQLGNLPEAELEAALIPYDPGPSEDREDFWAKEASLLADAAATLFQLSTSKPKLKSKNELYGDATKLYEEVRKKQGTGKESLGPQWFERSRQLKLLLQKLAEWIIERERLHRESQRSDIGSTPNQSESKDQEAAVGQVTPQVRSQVKDRPGGAEEGSEQPATPTGGEKRARTEKPVPTKKLLTKARKPARTPPVLQRPRRSLFSIGAVFFALLFALLVAGVSMLANGPKDRNLEEARNLFKIEGNDVPKFAWKPDPPPKNPTDAKGTDVAVFVCEQTVSRCSAATPGAVKFRLTDIHQEDRGQGLDNWDFTFKPYRGDTPIRTQLQLFYRANTDGAKVAALVWGDPGDDSLPENVVGQLNGFSTTAFAEDFLHKLQNDGGLRWAKEAGLETTARRTGLVERATGGGQPPSAVPLFPSSTRAWSKPASPSTGD